MSLSKRTFTTFFEDPISIAKLFENILFFAKFLAGLICDVRRRLVDRRPKSKQNGSKQINPA
jgi:hypothetical protein